MAVRMHWKCGRNRLHVLADEVCFVSDCVMLTSLSAAAPQNAASLTSVGRKTLGWREKYLKEGKGTLLALLLHVKPVS